MSTFAEQYQKLLKEQRQEDLFPLLQTLSDADKKKFIPELKKLDTIYFKYGITGKSRWGGDQYGYFSTDAQRHILGLTHFVVYNRKDFERGLNIGIVQKDVLDTILPWYCPTWFSDHINRFAETEVIPNFIDYSWYMELINQGHVEESDQLIARILPRVIFRRVPPIREYQPEKLLERPVTLQKHIWHLFEYDNEMHWSDGADELWKKTFRDLCAKEVLPRTRVLKETASAINRNLNQTLSNWFTDLFIQFEPSKEELIGLQPILLNTLNSPHSKPVNTVLKFFKDLAGDDSFNHDEFMDHCPLVLSAESKTTVTNTLMILEKLAKKDASKRNEICILASQALIHQDEKLQVRTAKLIAKYADSALLDVWEAVSAYQQGLLFEAKSILEPFLMPEAPIEDDETSHISTLNEQEELQPIAFPENFDELVYLASQAFDQNEAYHFDLLPAAILKFQDQMTESNIRKLLPAFQRAFKTMDGDWVSTRGYLESMLAKFMSSYSLLLVEFYPAAAQSLKELRQEHLNKLKEKNRDTKWFESGIKAWEVFTHSKGYKPHKHILLNAFWALEHKLWVPLLSTPTHQPCLVAIEALISRISVYQGKKTRPGLMDYQVAVMRCFVDNKDEAITQANSLLTGEPRQLIGFILGEDYQPNPNYHLKQVWLVAALTHRRDVAQQWMEYSKLDTAYLLANFSWSSYVEYYEQDRYNYQTRLNEKIPATRTAVIVSIDKKEIAPALSGIKSLWNKLTGSKTVAEYEEGYFDFIELKYQYITAEQNDIKRLIYLSPQWPEHWLAYISRESFRYFDLTGENEKRLVVNTLETLMTLSYKYEASGHLFIATCMLLNDKTVRLYAAELWIKGVKEQTINSEKLGEVIGKHEYNGLAPLKRFTDLILSNMFHISPVHDNELEKLLAICIGNMNTKPLNNTKKLLDIYLEVLAANKHVVNDPAALKNLNAWAATNSLSPVIEKIKKGFAGNN